MTRPKPQKRTCNEDDETDHFPLGHRAVCRYRLYSGDTLKETAVWQPEAEISQHGNQVGDSHQPAWYL